MKKSTIIRILINLFFISVFLICTNNKLNAQTTLHVDGRAGTLVADVGIKPNILLDSGNYTVSLSGEGIRLWTQQPNPFRYIILWEGNTNRHWFIKAGESQNISIEQQPSQIFAFLVDVNNSDSR